MAKETKKVSWLKPHPKFAYFEGDNCEMPITVAEVLLKSKHVKEFVVGVKPKPTPDLPNDMPGRDALMAYGIITMAEVKAIKDFTEIKGIGKSTHAQIVDYLIDSQS